MNYRNHQRTLIFLIDFMHNRDYSRKFISISIILDLKDENSFDNASLSSYFVFFNDSISRFPSPKFERLTSTEEFHFFSELYQDLSDALDRWKVDVKKIGKTIENMNISHKFMNLSNYFEKNVLMRKCSDDKGY